MLNLYFKASLLCEENICYRIFDWLTRLIPSRFIGESCHFDSKIECWTVKSNISFRAVHMIDGTLNVQRYSCQVNRDVPKVYPFSGRYSFQWFQIRSDET